MIDYKESLNDAQYAAVTAENPSVLVVAGAGSGKTRTIVYRLAWLTEQGIRPESMLLLTFTRKAAREMLTRAHQLLGRELTGMHGGTFHSFAFHILRMWHPDWLGDRAFTMMDQEDITEAIAHCKDRVVGKHEQAFPKPAMLAGLFSKSRNKDIPLARVIEEDSYHLCVYTDEICAISDEYAKLRREQGLMDYDDLLFELNTLIQTNPAAADYLHHIFRYVLVDEYQDTNTVQAGIVRGLAFDSEEKRAANIMAVGDEAQSIYAFRGATVRNIIDFPKIFPGTEIIRLEENYRSTQPILDVANVILRHADESFHKNLFTRRKKGKSVRLFYPKDEDDQTRMCMRHIQSFLRRYPPEEIAVLFRTGHSSYSLEFALNSQGLPYRKYGGIRYLEAKHIKDCIAYARLLINPYDNPSFSRIAQLHRGLGAKTVEKLYNHLREGDEKAFDHAIARHKGLVADLAFLDDLRGQTLNPASLMAAIVDHYQPILQQKFVDDWPSRRQGLDEIIQMAQNYNHIDTFLTDLVLENGTEKEQDTRGHIILSTVHSAKGLEWDAVLIIDLVEDRFPSRHALNRQESFEEERRLMYVACTRARKELHLYSPKTVCLRQKSFIPVPATASPFVDEIVSDTPRTSLKYSRTGLYDCPDDDQDEDATDDDAADVCEDDICTDEPGTSVTDWTRTERSENRETSRTAEKKTASSCYHSIFGHGKIICYTDDSTVQAEFPAYGVKTIRVEYLTLED